MNLAPRALSALADALTIALAVPVAAAPDATTGYQSMHVLQKMAENDGSGRCTARP